MAVRFFKTFIVGFLVFCWNAGQGDLMRSRWPTAWTCDPSLTFSWLQGSGRPTRGARWHEHRQQECWWSSYCFPRRQSQPGSRRCLWCRPEDRQSLPETTYVGEISREHRKRDREDSFMGGLDYHAGSGTSSSSTDHDIRDVAAPVDPAVLVGQKGQGSLLQLVGSTGSCGRQGGSKTFWASEQLPLHNRVCVCEGSTQVVGQAPARGDAGWARGEVIGGLSKADRGNMGVQCGGAGQLDEGNVVVDGAGVPLGVGEHLRSTTGSKQSVGVRDGGQEADWLISPDQESESGCPRCCQHPCRVLQRSHGDTSCRKSQTMIQLRSHRTQLTARPPAQNRHINMLIEVPRLSLYTEISSSVLMRD